MIACNSTAVKMVIFNIYFLFSYNIIPKHYVIDIPSFFDKLYG